MTLEQFRKWFEDLKAERVQDRSSSEETPMTPERIHDWAAAAGYRVISVPIAIQKTYSFPDFDAAVDFVATDVRFVAAQLGLTPEIVVHGAGVTVTLGVPMPTLLLPADFDFAEALQAMAPTSATEPKSATEPESDADVEADPETDHEPTDGS